MHPLMIPSGSGKGIDAFLGDVTSVTHANFLPDILLEFVKIGKDFHFTLSVRCDGVTALPVLEA
jgi:hypothetical protein